METASGQVSFFVLYFLKAAYQYKKLKWFAMKIIIGIAVLVIVLCTGCSVEKTDATKVKDLEYSIVKEEDIPEELKTVIESKKQQIFKLSYEDKEEMYIAVGYGEQQTGGYSIQVKEFYLSENAIYFDTELQGPKKEEAGNKAKSYPYVVIKTDRREESIVFQ